MSDALMLYQAVSKLINDVLPDMLEANRITLAQMITGIFRGQNVQFRKIAQKVWYRHKKSSLADKFRRFVRNKNIKVEVEYLPFARLILSSLSTCQKQLVLAIDGTKIGGACICLMVSIHYKSRALPLCWLVYKGKKGHSPMETQLKLLRAIQSLIPENAPPIIFLGDGEFDGSLVIYWLKEKTDWKYACRTSLDVKVFYQGKWVALRDLPLKDREEAFFSQVLFTESSQVGPTNIAAVWNKKEDRHWFIVTNLGTLGETQKWYKKRFTIETLFSDIKGRGFNVNVTRLFKPDRVSRLLLAVAIADLLSVFLGVELIRSGKLGQFARTDAPYYSLFQLGLIYLDHLLNERLEFPTLNLPPPDSFDYLCT